MSSHPFDAHSHSHSHDRLKRVYILPQDPGPPPYYFKPLMVPFEWRHLPSLPAILDPSLARIVDGYLRKTCKPDVMELAFDGDGFVHHALTQAIRDACPSRSLSQVNYLRNHMRSNTTFSYLALCYRLIAPNSYHTQKRYADVFEAHIGALYPEAKKTGSQGQVEALVAAMFGADVWPVLRDSMSPLNGRIKLGTSIAGAVEGRTTKPSGRVSGEVTDADEPVFLHHSRREVIDLTGLEDEEDEDNPEPVQPTLPRRMESRPALDASDDESDDWSDDIDQTLDSDDSDDDDNNDDMEAPAHRREMHSAPPYITTDEDHAQARTSASLNPGAKRTDRTRRQGAVARVACRRNDVDHAATKRAKRAKRAAAEARRKEKASEADGS